MSDEADIVRPITRPLSPPDTHSFNGEVDGARAADQSYRNLSGIVAIVCAAGALVILGLCVWFFAGFVDTDRGFWHLIQAFLISFGPPALFYAPLLGIAGLARRARRAHDDEQHRIQADPHLARVQPLSKRTHYIILMIVLPWYILAGMLARLGTLWAFSALITVCVVTLIVFWVWAGLRRSRILRTE